MSDLRLVTQWRGLILAIGVTLALAGCSAGYEGEPKPHFDGKVFSNPGYTKQSSVLGYLWLRLTSAQATWPEAVPIVPVPPPPRYVDGSEPSARVTLIGHATLLIQIAGINILTDPVWSERASFVQWAGPKRVSPPSLPIEDLPPIDVVLISHNHYDHLDRATLKRLDARHKPRVIVPLGNKALVQSAMPQSPVSEHDWGERLDVSTARGRLAIIVEPMLHGSGRSPWDQMKTLWASYVIEGAGLKILHVGDSGYLDGAIYRRLGAKYGGFDLALLPIGAYEPAQFMADSHMRPRDAVKAMIDLQAKQAMAHHYETFQLGFEGFDAPRNEALAALEKAGIPRERFALPRPGEHLVIRAPPTAVK